jgi:tetratricopeptide (TPR) repeat protein
MNVGCARLVAILLAMAATMAAEVRVWQGTLALPVYQEGLPDVNPPFDIFAAGRYNYPYTLRTVLTGHAEKRELRALFLENEYLRCSVLPDIGGHLYSCTDRLSGTEMFYANSAIKKQLIGYRGAWAAFGVEFNFPVSHNWMSMSPVDFATRQNADGSASLFVSNTDRPYDMQWRVELVLRPGSTVLEQRVTLYNSSALRRRYYYWNNAGVRITDDSHIVYPMRFSASHGFTYVDTWPVNLAGKDLSVVRNHTSGPVSQFVHGSREPFMGVWHPHNSTGIVHYAEYADLPGKKIWSFGVDADGLDWRRALSDDTSGYVEVQAGPFRNQETYAFLPPQETVRFSEYWMPVRALGGITRANLHGVVHLRREAGRLVASLNVNHDIAGATVLLRAGERVLAQRTADMAPERVVSIEAADPPAEHCTFELKQNGGVLLAHTEDTFDWVPESEIRTGPQVTVDRDRDPLELGQEQELNGALPDAAATYARALAAEPDNFELNKAAGRLAAALKNYSLALQLLGKAQYRRSNDAELHYYLGVAHYGLGEFASARAEWEGAQRQPTFRPAARFLLARLRAAEGDLTGALRVLGSALAERPDMVRAGGLEVALLRTLGDAAGARERLRKWRAEDPTSALLRVESVLLGTPDEALWRHLSADPERVLEVVVDYLDAGLYRDAVNLLSRSYPDIGPDESEPGTPRPQDYALLAYYRGYCRAQLGQSPADDYAKAASQSTRYVFPYRPETLRVLRAALSANPSDAIAHFYLGSLLISGGMTVDAVKEWDAARELNPRIPVLHRNLGRTLLSVNRDERRALEVFQQGLAVDPSNAELFGGLSQAQAILRRAPEERIEALSRYPDQKALPTPLLYDLALSLAEVGAFDKARALFRDRVFEREEGGVNVREVFLEVQMLAATALARQGQAPAARGILDALAQPVKGLEFTRDGLGPILAGSRCEFYLGRIEALLGSPEGAREHWRAAVKGNDIFAVLASRSLGDPAWRPRAEGWLAGNERAADSESLYRRGVLLRALGRTAAADESLAEALRQSDRRLAHYMVRRAWSGADDESPAR